MTKTYLKTKANTNSHIPSPYHIEVESVIQIQPGTA